MAQTVSVALFVRLEAKRGKEADVEQFLRGGLALVRQEPATTAWFGIRLDQPPSAFLTPFPTKQAVRLICQDRLPLRLWLRLLSSSRNLPASRKSTCSPLSFPSLVSQNWSVRTNRTQLS